MWFCNEKTLMFYIIFIINSISNFVQDILKP